MEFDGPSLPLRASGELSGVRWELRGSVIGDATHTWVSYEWKGGGGGGGGSGCLPYADLGWKVLGAIAGVGEASGGWSGPWFRRTRYPTFLDGAVAREVALVRIELEDAGTMDALLVDSDSPAVRFFIAVVPSRSKWRAVIALDASGLELDRAIPFVHPRS